MSRKVQSPTTLGYRVFTGSKSADGYRKLGVRVYILERHDLAEDLLESIGRSYFESNAKAVAAVKEETGDTVIFRDEIGAELDFEWQDDNDSRDEWYGFHVDFRPSRKTLPVLTRIMAGIERDTFALPPRDILGRLAELKAIPVQYSKAARAYYCDTAFSVDTAIPAPQIKADNPPAAELVPA